jgi:NADPH:quinone reductase-like Zn-dependent oxidoreductase
MKAIVVHNYGGPGELQWEEYRDPVPGPGEVLVRTAATSVNPIDFKRHSGAVKDFAPIKFPGILGVDISGTVIKIGDGVHGFSVGDRVFGMADQTYAELCVVKADALAKVPEGIALEEAAALPLVTTTGNQLISQGTGIQTGQTVLIAGAAGMVGRSAIFTAKERGAKVIAGVLKKQLQEAASLDADQVIATDDDRAFGSLPQLDAVADTVGGKTAQSLISKVKEGGTFATVLGPPPNAKEFPTVKVVSVYAKADANTLAHMAQAVKAGILKIPVSETLPLKDAAKGQAAAEKGGIGKVLLVVSDR